MIFVCLTFCFFLPDFVTDVNVSLWCVHLTSSTAYLGCMTISLFLPLNCFVSSIDVAIVVISFFCFSSLSFLLLLLLLFLNIILICHLPSPFYCPYFFRWRKNKTKTSLINVPRFLKVISKLWSTEFLPSFTKCWGLLLKEICFFLHAGRAF